MRSVALLLVVMFGLLRGGAGAQPRSLVDLKLLRTLELTGATYHVQGVEVDGTLVWVTSCDKPSRKGYLQQFSLATGRLERSVEIQDGERYHAGGLAADATSLWIPIAEYRRGSTSLIEQRSRRDLAVLRRFRVPDHIGCVAATSEFLVGGNWDSREFYVWNRRGELLRKVANLTGNNYQDMKFDAPYLVASGVLPGDPQGGAIDWLEWPSLRLVRRIGAGKTDRGAVFTQEGMAIRGGRLFLLPEDVRSRLFVFELP